MATVEAVTVRVGDLTLGYRALGSGPTVLLLHGWPTSSYLWRGVMPALARKNRVIAPDLPGFGVSDKPRGVRYDFEFFESALDRLLGSLGINKIALAVHDLGGPVGLHWTIRNPSRVTKLALLNTLVYPELSDGVKQFVNGLLDPVERERMTSPAGLEEIFRLGLSDRAEISLETIAAVVAPFSRDEDRLALARAGVGLRIAGFAEIAAGLPSLRMPVRIIYGALDRLLPDVAETMARVARDVPQAEVTVFPDRGHFIQEEVPDEVGELLAEFFAR